MNEKKIKKSQEERYFYNLISILKIIDKFNKVHGC